MKNGADPMIFPLPATVLEYLILGFLENQDSYGYEICQNIKQVQNINEPKLYPILKKLMEAGYIGTYEKNIGGRRRKYYFLQPEGAAMLTAMKKDWMDYVQGINQIVSPVSSTETERN